MYINKPSVTKIEAADRDKSFAYYYLQVWTVGIMESWSIACTLAQISAIS